MSVGIYDADMATYTLVPFNLEAMKLSAYYKRKGEIVVLSPSFTPERNTKFIYRKDYNDGDFPPNLLKFNNIEYGGLAFSNNIYQPLAQEIEMIKPDTSLYERMENFMKRAPGRTKEKNKIFQNMMTAEHCRISLDGKNIWEHYPRQFISLREARNIMFHDYDLGAVDGGFQEVQKILDKARKDGWATKVGMKFPVQVQDGQSLINWSSLNANSTFYSLRYTGVIEDEPFIEWVSRRRSQAVYTQMEYNVTAPWYDPNEFVEKMLPKIFRQVIISRSYRVFFSLKYDEGFFPDRRWEAVIQLFNYYHNSYANQIEAQYLNKIAEDTLYNFACNTSDTPYAHYGEAFTKDQVRQIFAFVRMYHYPLFKDFYECSAQKLGGKL